MRPFLTRPLGQLSCKISSIGAPNRQEPHTPTNNPGKAVCAFRVLKIASVPIGEGWPDPGDLTKTGSPRARSDSLVLVWCLFCTGSLAAFICYANVNEWHNSWWSQHSASQLSISVGPFCLQLPSSCPRALLSQGGPLTHKAIDPQTPRASGLEGTSEVIRSHPPNQGNQKGGSSASDHRDEGWGQESKSSSQIQC